jgi:hypothetical protein
MQNLSMPKSESHLCPVKKGDVMPSSCDVAHWVAPRPADVDIPDWLWAPEAIEALPWADKLPNPELPPDGRRGEG